MEKSVTLRNVLVDNYYYVETSESKTSLSFRQKL